MTLPLYTEEVALGDDSTTLFEFGFEINDATYLEVYLQNIAEGTSVLIDPSDYTVVGVGAEDGGSITFTSIVPTTAQRVVMVSTQPYHQGVSLINQGGYYPTSVEGALDKLERQIQQLRTEVGRSVRGAVGEGELSRMPAAPGRANNLVGFDESGDLALSAATNRSADTVTMGGGSLHPARPYYNILRDFISIKSIATCGGLLDSTDALIKALGEAVNDGFKLHLPSDTYYIDGAVSTPGPSTGTQGAPLRFGIQGDGRRNSVFILPSSNTSGGISIPFTGAGNKWWTCDLHNFGILVEGQKNFDLLSVTSKASIDQISNIIMREVDIWGTSTSVALTSRHALNFKGTARPQMSEGYIISANQNADRWTDADQAFVMSRAINLDDCYAFSVRNMQIVGARTAISSVEDLNSSEGGEFLNIVYNRALTGIRFLRGGTFQPILSISKASPGVLAYSGADPVGNNNIFIDNGDIGMVEVSDREFMVKNLNTGAKTFTLGDAITGADIDTTTYGAYIANGRFKVHGQSGLQPGPIILGGGGHARESCIDISGINSCVIAHQDLSISSGAIASTNGHGFALWAKNYTQALIDHLTIMRGSVATQVPIYMDPKGDGVNVAGSGSHAMIDSCMIGGSTGLRGIWFGPLDVGSRVGGNMWFKGGGCFTDGEIFDESNQVLCEYVKNSDSANRFIKTLRHGSSNALEGPVYDMWRDSPTPADGDAGGGYRGSMNDSLIAQRTMFELITRLDTALSGSHAGGFDIWAAVAGALVKQGSVGSGMELGSPTGGRKGLGTLNLLTALYTQGDKILGLAKSGWAVPTSTLVRTALATYNPSAISGSYTQAEVQAIQDELKIVVQTLAALINDLHVGGSGSTHGLVKT